MMVLAVHGVGPPYPAADCIRCGSARPDIRDISALEKQGFYMILKKRVRYAMSLLWAELIPSALGDPSCLVGPCWEGSTHHGGRTSERIKGQPLQDN